MSLNKHSRLCPAVYIYSAVGLCKEESATIQLAVCNGDTQQFLFFVNFNINITLSALFLCNKHNVSK